MVGMADRAWLMAIDASLAGTAIVVAGKDLWLADEFGTDPKDWPKTIQGRMNRYLSIVDPIKELARKWYPQYLFIEEYAHNAKGRSHTTMAEFGGVLRREIIGYFDVGVEVPPTVIKKFMAGKGTANKAQMVSAVVSRYGVAVSSDNAADAIALATLGLVVAGYEEPQTKYQAEAAETVRKLLLTQE